MTLREDIGDVWQVSRDEARNASLSQRLKLGGAAVAIGLEWAATEASLAFVAGTTLSDTHSPVLAALATGGTSFAEQAVFGLATVASIHSFPETFAAIRSKLDQHKEAKNLSDSSDDTALEPVEDQSIITESDQSLSKVTSQKSGNRATQLFKRFGIAFGFGTSIVAMKNNAQHELSTKENVTGVIVDAGLIGTGVLAGSLLVTEAVSVGDYVGYPAVTEGIVNVITNPFVLVGAIALNAAIKARSHRGNSPS